MFRDSFRAVLVALVATTLSVASGSAQAPEPLLAPKQNVVSANPFGIMFELFNAEYERATSKSTTAGFGGSTVTSDDDRYLNADVFYRYYPNGTAFEGWSFGVKVGLTRVTSEGTYFGYGFDANRSWLMGESNNFYVGTGFGLKRLMGDVDQFGLRMVPTLRLVNIGYAF
jgi:hypothetical protein